MTIYFTSDLHLDHANIIKYCNRPFDSVEQMNELLIKNWNSVVNPEDEVYVLGDLVLSRPDRAISLVRRLNGQKFLIEGNHDKKLLKVPEFRQFFVWVRSLSELKVHDIDAYRDTQSIVLCHYAMRVWNKSHAGAWHLYGHSHGTLPDDPNSLSFDVGVDANHFKPLSYQEVKAHMKKKTWKPIDHHVADRE